MIFLKRASASFMHKEDQTACLREMEAAGNWVDSLSLIFHRTLLLKSCMRKKGLFLVSTQHEMLLFILSRILRASELSQGSEWDSVTVRHFSGGLWRIKKKMNRKAKHACILVSGRSQWKPAILCNRPWRVWRSGDVFLLSALLSTLLQPQIEPQSWSKFIYLKWPSEKFWLWGGLSEWWEWEAKWRFLQSSCSQGNLFVKSDWFLRQCDIPFKAFPDTNWIRA